MRIDNSSFEGAGRTFGRFTYSKTTPGSAFDIPGELNSQDAGAPREDYQLSLGHTQTLSSNLLAEANLGILRSLSIRTPTSDGIDVANVLGIQRSPAQATPRISINGFQTLGTGAGNPLLSLRDFNVQLSGAVSYASGNNTLKIGAQYRRNAIDTFAAGTQFAGVYNFSGEITAPNTAGSSATAVNGLADFLLGAVRSASYQIPQPTTPRRNYNLGIFAQDDLKITPRLTLNLGVRYEYESPLTVANDLYARVDPNNGELIAANRTNPRTGRAVNAALDTDPSKLNFAPRVGLAYSFDDKTVLRTAFGVFYSQNFSNIGGIILVPGFTATRQFQNIGTGGAAQAQPFTLSQGIPLDAVQNLNDPFAAERAATVANPLAPGAQFGDIRKLPSSIQYNLGIQRQLPGAVIVDVSYVGAQARNLPLSLQSNPIPFERAEELARIGNAQTTQAARRFPLVTAFGAIYNVGSSAYNSLQVKGQRQFAQNFAFQTVYTFSKSIDDGSGVFPFSQPNGIDVGQFPDRFRNLDRGLSSFDRPHSFSFSAVYNTDGFPNAIRFLRGFQISPFFILRSGLPDTITQNNFNPAVSQQRPNQRNSNSLYANGFVGEAGGVRYLQAPTDPNFALAPSGPFFTGTGANRTLLVGSGIGSLGRNTIRLPRELNLDVTVSRRIRFTESIRLELRVEGFNVLNTVNFFGLNTGLTVGAVNNQAVFTNTNFGLLTQARPGRALQFGFKFEF